jgi:hypothetical protein
MATNGRGDDGRFRPGCPPGPGRPKRANEFRAVMLDAVSDDDVRAVMVKLVEQARAGQPWAVTQFLDRVAGKPINWGTGSRAEEALEGTTLEPWDIDSEVRAMDATIPRVPPADHER